MKISRGTDLKLNMGNYESLGVSAMVTLSHEDIGLTDEEVANDPDKAMQELREAADEYLELALKEEIMRAERLTEAEKTMLIGTPSIGDRITDRRE